jgi:hypothetical protein
VEWLRLMMRIDARWSIFEDLSHFLESWCVRVAEMQFHVSAESLLAKTRK